MCSIVVCPRRVVGNTFLIHEGARRTATAERQRQLLFVHEGSRRGTKNGNCRTATATSFCPRRAAKGHGERQLQNGNGNFFLSTKGREGARRTATAERQRQLLFVHEGPREGARRTATAERQRQLLFVHEGPRRGTKNGNCRTATATSFCPQRAAKGTKNGNCRTATATSFCPRRATKGHEERQLQNGNGNFFLSTKGHDRARRTATAERQRQASFCPRRATKGHEERQLQNGNGNFFLSTKGREGARRTATAERQRQLLFVHEGPRRGTKNGNCRTATATSFCPRRATKNTVLWSLQTVIVELETWARKAPALPAGVMN